MSKLDARGRRSPRTAGRIFGYLNCHEMRIFSEHENFVNFPISVCRITSLRIQAAALIVRLASIQNSEKQSQSGSLHMHIATECK